MLVRARLLAVLQGRFERRVTVLVAGPGFGKTTLLTQAMTENRLDPRGEDRWLRCGTDDASAPVLAGRLCALLGAPEPTDNELDALADAVVAGATALAPVPVALVLDDVHVIPDDAEGAELLALLLDRLPANAHVVLASRRKPALPLARLVAQGSAVRLGEPELAFTDEELAAFAALRGTSVDPLRTLGRWPAIAELAVAAGPSIVEEYLWEEALGALPAERRRQLAALSALGGADEATMAAALDAPVDLEALVEGVPLVTVTDDGRAELHALWAEHLVPVLTPDELTPIRRRAGRHLLCRGERTAAFRLLAEAGAWPEALGVVAEACAHVYLPVEPDVLAGWLASLPTGVQGSGEPAVPLARGVLAKERSGDLVEARRHLEQALAGFEVAGDQTGQLACAVHLFSVGYSLDDAELLGRALTLGFQLDASGCGPAAPVAAIGRAGLADFSGDFAGALDELDRAPATPDDEWAAILTWMRADLLDALGRPDDALDAVAKAEHRGRGPAADQLESIELQALWSVGRIDEALELGQRALARVGQVGSLRAVQRAHALAARYQAYLGRAEDARRSLAELERHPPADRVIERRVRLARAAVAVLEGDEAAAAAELEALDGGGDSGERLVRNKTILRALPLVYVLLADTRPTFDDAVLGPSLARWRALARAVVGVRAGDLAPVRALPEELPAGPVRSGLPLPWAVELAAALEQVGAPSGRALLVALGPAARDVLERVASDPDHAARKGAKRLVAEVPTAPAGAVTVRLLGPPELLVDGQPAAEGDWRRDRVRQLLAFLATRPGASREAVADALWPDLGADAGANNLRATLSYLLGVLEPDRRGKRASYFVAQRGRTLALTGHDHLEIDVWRFEELLAEGEAAERSGAPSVALEAYRAAAELWRGPFLAGSPAPWAEDEGERLQTRFVTAASRAAELALAAGDAGGAAALAERVLATDPWSERAYRVLATSQLHRGDRSGALATLNRALAMLDELGVEPEAATSMVVRRLRGGDGGG